MGNNFFRQHLLALVFRMVEKHVRQSSQAVHRRLYLLFYIPCTFSYGFVSIRINYPAKRETCTVTHSPVRPTTIPVRLVHTPPIGLVTLLLSSWWNRRFLVPRAACWPSPACTGVTIRRPSRPPRRSNRSVSAALVSSPAGTNERVKKHCAGTKREYRRERNDTAPTLTTCEIVTSDCDARLLCDCRRSARGVVRYLYKLAG